MTNKEFSVNNLFPESRDIPIGNGTIDINLVADVYKQDIKIFDASPLIKTILEDKKKLYDIYNEHFKQCCEEIYKANNIGKTFIMFQIPQSIIGITEYNSSLNLQLIQKRLFKQNINSHINSKTEIFVTWGHLEKELFSSKKVNK
jgi:hypothetical protein